VRISIDFRRIRMLIRRRVEVECRQAHAKAARRAPEIDLRENLLE
jgi:hypothetical protein